MRFALTTVAFILMPAVTNAADQLPLKHGIFVMSNSSCEDENNADVVSYWGGDNGLNVSQDSCKIVASSKKGTLFSLKRVCTDMNDIKRNDIVKIAVKSPTAFTFDATPYRWCSEKMK